MARGRANVSGVLAGAGTRGRSRACARPRSHFTTREQGAFSVQSLRAWVRITEGAPWKNFAEARYSFSSASYVSPCVIFNIAHGKAWLLTVTEYDGKLVAVDSILTHAEYDREGF
jgi:mRNA interferase HigB